MKDGKPDLYLWQECRKGRHVECGHVAHYGGVTFRGMIQGVTVCTCGCHRDCPATLLDPALGYDALQEVCTDEPI